MIRNPPGASRVCAWAISWRIKREAIFTGEERLMRLVVTDFAGQVGGFA